jgi:thymidylate synthase (FAD)
MNIVKAGYEILNPITESGIKELQFIEKIGRTCYLSEDRITEDGESALKFNEMILRREHEAMIEHSLLSVRFTVDRGVSHEMVRHRVASFAQESTRYVNYAKEKFGNEISVIDPINGMTLDTKMKNMDLDIIGEIYEEWLTAMEDAEKHYMRMIELGATPQMARSVLPHSTKTSIVITTNYREWRHFFELRTPKDAHPQIREVAIPLLRELQQKITVIFDDIEVEE